MLRKRLDTSSVAIGSTCRSALLFGVVLKYKPRPPRASIRALLPNCSNPVLVPFEGYCYLRVSSMSERNEEENEMCMVRTA